MRNILKIFLSFLIAFCTPAAWAAEPPPMLWTNADTMANLFHPVFDFDRDGCYPSVGIGRNGVYNGGEDRVGAPQSRCRDLSDLNNSNVYSRTRCRTGGGAWGNRVYCATMYSLYFQKDQVLPASACDGCDAAGHRHDVESVIIWTISRDDWNSDPNNKVITDVTISQHRDRQTLPANSSTIRWWTDASGRNTHPKIVYHKDGGSTHVLRFGNPSDETIENHWGRWWLNGLVTWENMSGDGSLNNAAMRNLFNNPQSGVNYHFNDQSFCGKINGWKPSSFPAIC